MTDNSSPLWPADNPAVTTHIKLVQGIVNRLANSGSSCKTWCLALVTALLTLAGAMKSPAIVASVLVPVVIFGFLDMMYLAQEKAYRDLYERIVVAVRNRSYQLGDAFDATAGRTLGHVGWALASWSIWPIYGGLIVAYIVASCFGWVALLAAPP